MPSESQSLRAVERAVDRARRVLLHTQKPDGSWDVPGQLGPFTTAQVLVVLHHLGRLGPEDAASGAKWLRAQQRPDGSFALYPLASHGDLGTTACAFAALHVCGGNASTDSLQRARAFLDGQGGIEATIDKMAEGDFAAVYLAMAGLLDAKKLPCPRAEPLLVPAFEKWLLTRVHSGVLMMAFELEVVIRQLRGDFGPDGTKRGFLDRITCNRCVELLTRWQNRDGSWNDSVVLSVLAIAALKSAGLAGTDARLARATDWLLAQGVRDASGLRFDGFGTEVWTTGFDAKALLACGVPPSNPHLARAVEFLVDSQLDLPMPKVDNRQPGKPLSGGWAFQRTNHTMPDCDDTGVALSVLGIALAAKGADALPRPLALRARASADRGAAWVLGMQNPDGGWSAFVWGLPGKQAGPVLSTTPRVSLSDPLAMARALMDPPASMGDPSTEDVTSRVLMGLGHLGLSLHSPEVKRAVEFLRMQQCDSGAWWGRWVVNYLSCTAFVLMGLASVGADLSDGWVRRAVRWVLSKQNADGGWGEEAISYRDASQAGKGPSMAPLTGLVVQGLIAAGEGNGEAVERAVRYLVARQKPDGTWPNDGYLHTNIPPDTFYVLEEAARFYPTEALGLYAALRREHGASPGVPRWSDDVLDEARQRTDPIAEEVIAKLFRDGQVAAVNGLVGTLFRSDEPLPSGLPQAARDYFDATQALPDFADPAQIAIAQKLFTRAGWYVASALFCSSLPQAYAAARGATVLIQTQAMTNRLNQRIMETAQFLCDVLDAGALEPGGRGVRTAQKVRLMHAAVRHLIRNRPTPAWDASVLGQPINQEDQAGTLLTFSVVTLDALKLMNLDVTDAEEKAWIHTWNVVGRLLGIEQELLAVDTADAQALMDRIRERQWRHSPDGRLLARRLVELMQGYFPGQLLDGVPVAMVRHLAGDQCADLLGLPPADWTRVFLGAAAHLTDAIEPLEQGPGGKLMAVGTHLLMEGVILAHRQGKQAQFRIPEALKKTVDPNL